MTGVPFHGKRREQPGTRDGVGEIAASDRVTLSGLSPVAVASPGLARQPHRQPSWGMSFVLGMSLATSGSVTFAPSGGTPVPCPAKAPGQLVSFARMRVPSDPARRTVRMSAAVFHGKRLG